MTRRKELHSLLEQRKFFKLVCGAGNENFIEIEKLAFLYTLAGAQGYDVSATPHSVEACARGIDAAISKAAQFNVTIPIRPFIIVSIGMKGDPHVRKASITDACISCLACIPVCPTAAIAHKGKAVVIDQPKCIGCGNCESVCPANAIRYSHKDRIIEDSLRACIRAGAESIELHAAVEDESTVFSEWQLINTLLPDQYLSMCLDRLHLSNDKLVARIKKALELTPENMIVQADGVPMSGGKDDFNTTLQAIATAEVIQKHKLPVKVLLSGGTNSKTTELARLCDVDYHGVSIGTYGRNIVKEYLGKEDFLTNSALIKKALPIAQALVATVTKG